MAKAIASGDERLMQKAGLEADIARLVPRSAPASHFATSSHHAWLCCGPRKLSGSPAE